MPPSISGTVAHGSVLTATPGTWTGAPSITGQWYAGASPITGETGTTYTVDSADGVGAGVTYRETDSVSATSADSNTLPPTLDVLNPELLLDERGLTVVTGYSAWANQGTAGGNFVQATTGSQPGTGRTINGLAAPDFDGTDDSMLSSLASTSYMTTSQFEGAFVIQADAIPATTPPVPTTWYTSTGVCASVTSSPFGIMLTRDGLRMGTGTSPYGTTMYVPLYADGLPHLVQFRLVGGTAYISVDGGPERSQALANPTALGGNFRIGSNYADTARMNGLIASAFMRKTVLTTAERVAMRGALSEKYGINNDDKLDFMLVGDSIVAQVGAGTAQFRARLQSQAGSFFRASGVYNGANTPFAQDIAMAASGATTASILTNFTTWAVGTRVKADVVPILLGTNDIGVDGVSNSTLSTRYLALLADLTSRLPGALLVAQKLIPRTGGYSAQVADWNANYHDAMVASGQGLGYNVISDDALSLLSYTYLDGLHPDAAMGVPMGDTLAAQAAVWAAAA